MLRLNNGVCLSDLLACAGVGLVIINLCLVL